MADNFSRTQSRRIAYTRPTPAEYAARQAALGVADEFIDVMRMRYWTVPMGIGKKVTPELGELLGRPPITMAQYAADYNERVAAASAAEPGITGMPRLFRPVGDLMR